MRGGGDVGVGGWCYGIELVYIGIAGHIANSFTDYDLFAERLGDFVVTVSDIAPSESTDPSSSIGFTECHRYSGIPPASSTVTVFCDVAPIWGRYVTIYLPIKEALTICEVQVYGFNRTYTGVSMILKYRGCVGKSYYSIFQEIHQTFVICCV